MMVEATQPDVLGCASRTFRSSALPSRRVEPAKQAPSTPPSPLSTSSTAPWQPPYPPPTRPRPRPRFPRLPRFIRFPRSSKVGLAVPGEPQSSSASRSTPGSLGSPVKQYPARLFDYPGQLTPPITCLLTASVPSTIITIRGDSRIQLCIATFSSEIEAELAKAKLEMEGIAAFIAKDDCGGMRPHLQTILGVRLMVSDKVAVVAQRLLHEKNEERSCPTDDTN